MPEDSSLGSVLTLFIVVCLLVLIVGSRLGLTKFLRFLFAPLFGCAGRVVQAVVALVIVVLVLGYGISHVRAPGSWKLPEIPKPLPLPTIKPRPDHVILDVPFNKQELPLSGMHNNICGYASLSMGAGYVLGFQPSMETNVKMLTHLGLDLRGQQYSQTALMIKAGKEMYGLNLVSTTWSLKQIKDELDGGHPVIAGIRAGIIPYEISGYRSTEGHFLVVIGYDKDSIIVNDPGTRTGAKKHYSTALFAKAFEAEKSSVIHGFKR